MSESLVSYAALILADAEKDITSDNLQSVLSAAGASVDKIWIETFAKALEGQSIKEQLFQSSASVSAGSGAAGAAGATEASAEAGEEEEEKEEEEEESDDDMGMGLFD